MSRPPLEVADIFRKHGDSYRNNHGVSKAQRRVMRAIELCRTAALGGHLDECDHCGRRTISYNSCRNRHCPKCQSLAKAKWLEERQKELLPVEYFHVVFTVPEQIALIALQNKRIVYNILFRAVSETLAAIATDPNHLGARIGFLAVLHTWGQALLHHPHIHCVVPAGGFSLDRSQWIHCRKQFFLPVRVLSRMFRGKFLSYLRVAFQSGKLQFHGNLQRLSRIRDFRAELHAAHQLKWVVYCKRPFGGPSQVLNYLGRYTHRIAISNHRLLKLKNGTVTFRWKDYRNHDQPKIMTLHAEEFIRRFLLHVLPDRFVRIRHYGFLANRNHKDNLQLAWGLLGMPKVSQTPAQQDWRSRYQTLTGKSLDVCPYCMQGRMVRLEVLLPEKHYVDSS